MTPTIEQITGMESAYSHAKSLKPYSNMGISARLVIEMHDTIIAQHEEIERLKQGQSEIAALGIESFARDLLSVGRCEKGHASVCRAYAFADLIRSYGLPDPRIKARELREQSK